MYVHYATHFPETHCMPRHTHILTPLLRYRAESGMTEFSKTRILSQQGFQSALDCENYGVLFNKIRSATA